MNAIQKIETHPEKQSLITMLRLQLAKDLGLPPDAVPEQEILPWLHSKVERLQKEQTDWSQRLYRIDVPEIYAQENTEALAERILLREAQKVLFRWQYSA